MDHCRPLDPLSLSRFSPCFPLLFFFSLPPFLLSFFFLFLAVSTVSPFPLPSPPRTLQPFEEFHRLSTRSSSSFRRRFLFLFFSSRVDFLKLSTTDGYLRPEEGWLSLYCGCLAIQDQMNFWSEGTSFSEFIQGIILYKEQRYDKINNRNKKVI